MRLVVVIALAVAISLFFGGPFTFLAARLVMGVGDESVQVSCLTSGAMFLVVMLTAVWRALENFREKEITVWVSAIVPVLCSIGAVVITDGPAIIGLVVGILCSCAIPIVLGMKLYLERQEEAGNP